MTEAGWSRLQNRLESIARTPVLLVASDYDGTLAPIVADPGRAVMVREARVALRNLAQHDHTHVAVISGRSLRDLDEVAALPDDVRLVGSHGGEFDLDFADSLSAEQRERLASIVSAMEEVGARIDGLLIERKPASVALHYRNAARDAVDDVLAAVREGPARLAGVTTRHGKEVVELAVVPTNKGTALDRLRHALGATAVVFFGDDVTDEQAFETLRGPDIGVKVGPGATSAGHRLGVPTDVARALAFLQERREEWERGGSAVPIEMHSLLSDQRTAALVTPGGRISWLCVPRLDSHALFADLLGGPEAGYFDVHSANGEPPHRQSYRSGSMVLETHWPEFKVTDFLDCSLGRPRQRAGRTDLIRVLQGSGRVELAFAPRLDFGRVPTRLRPHANGLAVDASPQPIVLRSPRVAWKLEQVGDHHTARATIDLGTDPVVLDLRFGTANLQDTSRSGSERSELTDAYWRAWSSGLELPALEPELVLRSALTLKALCHASTGAVAAAATTSLPEEIGGVRNWDYRYCWPRDAALATLSLARLGSLDEGMAFLDWMVGVLDSCPVPSSLQPLYTLCGKSVPTEAEVGDLRGYRGSRPVRLANSAALQVQLDVFAPIVELVHLALEREAPISSDHWRLVEAMVAAVEQRWREPDHGIWEERLPPRHHVHSKVMCWVTVDRALKIAAAFLDQRRPAWEELRDAIRGDVLRNGWSESLASFASTYGGEDLDAAVLQIGLSGLLAPDDERFAATVLAIEQRLRDGPTVYRYRFDDGLPGSEGGFHLCTGWLIRAYEATGRSDDARALFRGLAALAGPTGLLSEQYDPANGVALGNFPQAYSHLELIDCATELAGS